jgi:putative toxin-antitoxin system antitoxin component (TIGR02293 family)
MITTFSKNLPPAMGKTGAGMTVSATEPGNISAPAANARMLFQAISRNRQLPRFTPLFDLSAPDQIAIIRDGISPDALKTMIQVMELSQEKVFAYLALSAATINRKIKREERLSPDESARVLGLASLIGQVQAMVERSGDPEGFDAAKWVAEWIERPLPALGGEKPAAYLDTTTGQQMVADLLAKMESGAYA